MNLLHLKYAVEVAKTQSISKAAEILYVGQPNLSRAIKELEESIGITIFKRTPKGMETTPDGEMFLEQAQKIVLQVDQLEAMYKSKSSENNKQVLSVCVPRASYISYALAEFEKKLNPSASSEIYYKETNSITAINSLIRGECNLAVIRYQAAFNKYFSDLFNEKKLISETITEFSYVLLISKDSLLAQKKEIEISDLADFSEITHSDPYVPSLPLVDVMKAELSAYVKKRIFVFERASQFVLLENVPETFMWVSPIPQPLLEKHNLVQRNCAFNDKIYKDVLIYRKGYRLSPLDNLFITEICNAKRKYL